MKAEFLNPPKLSAPVGFSHVVVLKDVRNLIFVSGQLPVDEKGNVVGVGDISAQTERVFENIGEALKSASARFSDIVRICFYLTDMSMLQSIRPIRKKYLPNDAFPTSTTVQIGALAKKDALIEVDAVAAIKD